MTPETELLREAVELLKASEEFAIQTDVKVDGEWGCCRTAAQLEAAKELSGIVYEIRAFLAKIDAADGEESEFQVISGADEDACIEAATRGPRDVALREAMRYAHQYAEDGPVKVVELVTVAMLPAARRQGEQDVSKLSARLFFCSGPAILLGLVFGVMLQSEWVAVFVYLATFGFGWQITKDETKESAP